MILLAVGFAEPDQVTDHWASGYHYLALDYATINGEDSFLANEWKCTVTVQYSVILPGRGKPLISNHAVSGTSKFLNGPDMETSRQNALRQSCFDAAKTIVAELTEGW